MESGILRGGRAGPSRPIAIGAPRPGAESSAAKSSEDRWGCTPMPATPELRTEAEARQSAVAQLHRGMPRALYHLQQQHHHHHMGAGLDVGLLHHVGHAFHSHGASSAHHQLQQQQQTVLQRLGLEHLQHYLRYSSAEPLELTACPLDLSVKSGGGRHLHELEHPITPPCTPSPSPGAGRPPTPEEARSPPKKKQQEPLRGPQLLKKSKATRKLTFDEENSSPVSGTIIRQLGPDETLVVRKGDIDPAFNVVEITEEAKAELAKIENHIGDYVCRLCKELYEDAFGLAQHRCSRIVHVEYRCPECDKVFNCPANLASHRRWHKPRPPKDVEITVKNEDPVSGSGDDSSSEQFPCPECGKKFRRMAYLRKHQAVHQVQVD